jgi:glycosyltransferase involved in cell wall biosynthesis
MFCGLWSGAWDTTFASSTLGGKCRKCYALLHLPTSTSAKHQLLISVQASSSLIEAITPLIITFDEVSNIARALDKLLWARRIVVVDSGSTDGTLDVLARYPQVALFKRAFDSFADQCNFGLAQVESEWVLSLDADYEISDGLVAELSSVHETEGVVGYRASFIYRIYGRPLRGTLYPPRIILYRVKNAHYTNEGHGHQVNISGEVRALKGVTYHDDRKPLSRWFTTQQSYAKLEADYLLKAEKEVLSVSDRLRRMAWPAPIAVFFYVLVVKGCLFDGWRGWFYALQRTLAESMIALQLIDRRLRREPSQD